MIGDKIRTIRKEKNMTMNDLAFGVGVTPSYISQVERNIVEPSVATLQKIAFTLEAHMYSFFDEEFKAPIITRRGEQPAYNRAGSSITYTCISPVAKENGNKTELFLVQVNPRNNDEYVQNRFDECLFVMKGSLTVFLENTSYQLENGDSIFIKENVPYKLFNGGAKTVMAISCISPGIDQHGNGDGKGGKS
ncbi:XRE family transcriptional regulator [Eubacteriales bacterium OttesenSCG-928-K08]|nr:XRE family transcriptional regulator [Eubacteriales bacterium OttesenSCG-928-K08]